MSKSSGNRNNGEDAFREWLSDHLRYLVLLIALLLAVVVIIMTVSLMDNRQGSLQAGAGDNPDAVVIMSETAAVEIRETQSEAASESGQIAEAVGYQDAKYFSRIFRKTVGIKPSEYRKLYQ